MCRKLDDQTSTCRREEERERGPVKLSNLRYALCVLFLSNLFFSFCVYAYLCVFTTAGAIELIHNSLKSKGFTNTETHITPCLALSSSKVSDSCSGSRKGFSSRHF